MEKKLAQCKSSGILEVVKYLGSKAPAFLKEVANHPLAKPIVYYLGIWLLGNKYMQNGYDATVDLGFVSFSLTKRT